MATKSLVTYTGPTSFGAESLAALASILERAFRAVDLAIRRLSSGGPHRWTFTDAIRGNAAVLPSVAIECDTVTSPSITLTLLPPDPRDQGLECGIVRLNAAGTITLFPAGGATLNGSTASAAIPGTAGFYVLVITPRGYWLRR